MQMSNLKPAYLLAQRFGVKTLLFGGPGTGKTPLVNTAPRPVLCVVEPGMLSMRNSKVPSWEANDAAKIDEFFKWLFSSSETKNFDTVCIDSMSELAEVFLADEVKKNRDGRKVYGEVSKRVMDIARGLFFLPEKHVFLIAKQTTVDENGIQRKKPFFPGQDLNVKIPHLYDEVLHIGPATIPGMPKPVLAIRTAETYDIMARDRSGKLAELEPPDLSALFAKVMT